MAESIALALKQGGHESVFFRYVTGGGRRADLGEGNREGRIAGRKNPCTKL
jgi:hypothetical protein